MDKQYHNDDKVSFTRQKSELFYSYFISIFYLFAFLIFLIKDDVSFDQFASISSVGNNFILCEWVDSDGKKYYKFLKRENIIFHQKRYNWCSFLNLKNFILCVIAILTGMFAFAVHKRYEFLREVLILISYIILDYNLVYFFIKKDGHKVLEKQRLVYKRVRSSSDSFSSKIELKRS